MGKIGKTGILGKSEIRVHRELRRKGVNTENNETYENWEYREYSHKLVFNFDELG